VEHTDHVVAGERLGLDRRVGAGRARDEHLEPRTEVLDPVGGLRTGPMSFAAAPSDPVYVGSVNAAGR